MKYLGGGFIPLIPARDLSDEDIKKHVVPALELWGIPTDPKEWLIATGLYEPVAKKKTSKPIYRPKKEGE